MGEKTEDRNKVKSQIDIHHEIPFGAVVFDVGQRLSLVS